MYVYVHLCRHSDIDFKLHAILAESEGELFQAQQSTQSLPSWEMATEIVDFSI